MLAAIEAQHVLEISNRSTSCADVESQPSVAALHQVAQVTLASGLDVRASNGRSVNDRLGIGRRRVVRSNRRRGQTFLSAGSL